MNYQKIYADFITSRRERESAIVGYSEKHHIIPRALGGGNEKSNLIRLTARDHYFAHCCLAKIHGGSMWSALHYIGLSQKTYHGAEAFTRGRLSTIARINAASRRSESMCALWKSGEFTRNRVYTPISDGHRAALRTAHAGVAKSKSAIEKRQKTMRVSAQVYEFVDTRSSRTFIGTQSEFSVQFQITQPLASSLTRGKIMSAKGWILRGTDVNAILHRNATIRTFNHIDGTVFVGTQYNFRTKFNLDAGVVSNLISGKNKVKSFKGWKHVTP